MNTLVSKEQGGFTLLELVVVVAVLGLIANLATEFVAQNTNQERFEATKAKQAMIREAILGNPSATQNGEVQVSGFIADTGRAPKHLMELLTQEYCLNEDAVYTTTADCNTAAAGDTSKQWNTSIAGWNGPYLHGYDLEKVYDSDEKYRFSFKTFRDGWGNTSSAWKDDSNTSAQLEVKDMFNFGWNYYTTSDDIYLLSAGLDGTKDPEDSDNSLQATTAQEKSYSDQNLYEQDYPRTVYEKLAVPIGSITYGLKKEVTLVSGNEYIADAIAKINNTTGSDTDVCIVAWNADLSSVEYVSSSLTVEGTKTETHSVQLPHGQYYVDVQTDPSPAPSTDGCPTLTSVSSGSSQCKYGAKPNILSTRDSIALNCTIE